LQNQTILMPGVANHVMHSQVDQKVHDLDIRKTKITV
jgi:hypothetical protein